MVPLWLYLPCLDATIRAWTVDAVERVITMRVHYHHKQNTRNTESLDFFLRITRFFRMQENDGIIQARCRGQHNSVKSYLQILSLKMLVLKGNEAYFFPLFYFPFAWRLGRFVWQNYRHAREIMLREKYIQRWSCQVKKNYVAHKRRMGESVDNARNEHQQKEIQ